MESSACLSVKHLVESCSGQPRRGGDEILEKADYFRVGFGLPLRDLHNECACVRAWAFHASQRRLASWQLTFSTCSMTPSSVRSSFLMVTSMVSTSFRALTDLPMHRLPVQEEAASRGCMRENARGGDAHDGVDPASAEAFKSVSRPS